MSEPVVDGLLVVDKPSGWTSHDVVARGRRLAGTRKVGHAGTLDPMATGVLLLGIGRATRLLGYLALATKSYQATIRLGQATVTDDAEGDVLTTSDTGGLTREDVERAIRGFRGDIMQVPSSVSAIKVDGERAYKRVRAGEDLDLPARPVHIAWFGVAGVRVVGSCLDVDVLVDCSTGTYVRALARDLGQVLMVGGHLTALRRTRVGSFTGTEAHTLESLAELDREQLPIIALRKVARREFAWYVIDSKDVSAVRNGRTLPTRLRHTSEEAEELGLWLDDQYEPGPDGISVPAEDEPAPTYQPGERGLGPDGPVAVLAPGGEFLALYEQHGPVAKAVAVFAPPPG